MRHTVVPHKLGETHCSTTNEKLVTHILDNERVAGDPLHGLEHEARQRHAFTAVVCGYFLCDIRGVDKHTPIIERYTRAAQIDL